jgi:hypothetical protein
VTARSTGHKQTTRSAENIADSIVASVCGRVLRQRFRAAGLFEPQVTRVTRGGDDAAIVALLTPGATQADELHAIVSRLIVDALFGDFGPDVSRETIERLDLVLAALEPPLERGIEGSER